MADGSELETALLDAHAAGDGLRLARLYEDAAGRMAASGNQDAEGFFLTQAWIFALEAGDRRAADLQARLRALGRA